LNYDAVVLTGGATDWRDLPIPGRELDGIHQAMEYLPWANRVQNGDPVLGDDGEPPITAKGKKVVIIGGGDTGADCLGTVHRQGAASVHQFEIMPRPPEERAESTPWPTYPLMYRVASAHEEGGERVFSVNTEEFVGVDGHVTGLKVHEVEMRDGRFARLDGSDFVLGPASDGGYWLFGSRRRPLPFGTFAGVRWSTAHALADTLASLPPCRRVALGPVLDDVDDA